MVGTLSTSIRNQLIQALSNAEGEFLSGQALAEIIGCSRTAIWKHIEELRRDGFVLEAVRSKGYRIISTPKKLSKNDILFGLETERFGRYIYYYDSVDSTQTEAHKLINEGAPEGTIVIADEQTSGKGRLAREWHSLKQKGVWMSLIIKPNLPPQQAPQYTLITAVAIARTIEQLTELTPEIKWPNDILINGKKVVGILTELQAEADQIKALIIGIGMNVNHKQEDFPKLLQPIATSLAIEKGEKVSRVKFIQTFLKIFEDYNTLYLEKGFAPLKMLWENYATSKGKIITATTISKKITGKAIGITDEGVLKLEDEQGNIHHIYSADIDIKP